MNIRTSKRARACNFPSTYHSWTVLLTREGREPLDHIVQAAFPILHNLMQQILQHTQIEAAQVMKTVLKIFWSCTHYALPNVQGINVDSWFSMFAYLIAKRLPESCEGLEPSGQPLSVEDRNAWPWWKVNRRFKSSLFSPRYCYLSKN